MPLIAQLTRPPAMKATNNVDIGSLFGSIAAAMCNVNADSLVERRKRTPSMVTKGGGDAKSHTDTKSQNTRSAQRHTDVARTRAIADYIHRMRNVPTCWLDRDESQSVVIQTKLAAMLSGLHNGTPTPSLSTSM